MTLAKELGMVRERKSNSERALIFSCVILRKDPMIWKAKAIRKRITKKLDQWEKGLIAELVQDTVAMAKRGAGGARKSKDDESIARKYHSMVIGGRLRAAVRMLSNRDGGGVMHPEDADTKSGRKVIDVLREKHPEMMIPGLDEEGWASFESYDECLNSVPVDCTEETVEEVAGKLSGGAGPGSVDAIAMKNWLLRHGRPSQVLREELAAWTEWLCNETPPWAAYRAMMSCRLVALDKCPGVRPLGIGEIWRRAIAKCALKVCGEDAKATCGSTQLCAGLEAGIEGALHSVSTRARENETMEFGEWEVDDSVWEQTADKGKVQESLPMRREREATATATTAGGEEMADTAADATEQEILLLVDAANGFNALSRLGMLWTVRHRCAKLSRFAFNCYRHEIRLVCRRPGLEALILLSKEGVTQGDPLAMALYGVALLPLAELLRVNSPEVMQPWYADDAAMMGLAKEAAACFEKLVAVGPQFGYHPEPAKSFVICPLADEEAAKAEFTAKNLPVKFCRGHRYVGGFVGSRAMQDRWVDPMVEKWVESIQALAKVAVRYPQSAYAGFSQSLQSEWQYLCRCVPGVEAHLGPVEVAIEQLLIPALMDMGSGEVTKEFRQLLANGVKQGGLNLRNPAAGAARLFQGSSEASKVLVKSLMTASALDSVEHKQCVRQAGAKARKERVESESEFVKVLMAGSSKAEKKRLERIGETGAWLTAMPNLLNNTLLSAEEWRDNARLRYGLRPIGLCDRCDGCGAGFSIDHAISCKKGGLVCQRHDNARDEAGELAAMALTTSRVSYEPHIFYGTGVCASQQATGEQRTGSNVAGDDSRGDVAVNGLWKKGETCILDIRITDTDAKSYAGTSSKKVLEKAAKVKKDKYLDACLERRRTFMPLVYSVDGMACKEAKAFEKRVASLMASKLDRQYSEMVGFVRSRMSLAIIRSNTMMLRGARVGRAFRPWLEDGAAFSAMEGEREL